MGVLITLGCPTAGLWTHVAPKYLPLSRSGQDSYHCGGNGY